MWFCVCIMKHDDAKLFFLQEPVRPPPPDFGVIPCENADRIDDPYDAMWHRMRKFYIISTGPKCTATAFSYTEGWFSKALDHGWVTVNDDICGDYGVCNHNKPVIMSAGAIFCTGGRKKLVYSKGVQEFMMALALRHFTCSLDEVDRPKVAPEEIEERLKYDTFLLSFKCPPGTALIFRRRICRTAGCVVSWVPWDFDAPHVAKDFLLPDK